MQMRICDCPFRKGGCFCELETEQDDKRTEDNSVRSNTDSKPVL